MLRLILALALAAGLASPASADDLSGTWNVTCKPAELNTCHTHAASQTSVYQWLLAQKEDGTVEVNVLGKTSFPNLRGRVDGTKLSVEGLVSQPTQVGRNVGVSENSAFQMTVKGKAKMTGRRYFLGVMKSEGDGVAAVIPCVVEYECAGTKQ